MRYFQHPASQRVNIADQRSRSPIPGLEASKPQGSDSKSTDGQVQQELAAIKHILEKQEGRLNTVDQRSAQTRDQMQKAQQLEASKQAIISSWPDSAGPQDRMRAIEDLVVKHDTLADMQAAQHFAQKPDGVTSPLLSSSQKQ